MPLSFPMCCIEIVVKMLCGNSPQISYSKSPVSPHSRPAFQTLDGLRLARAGFDVITENTAAHPRPQVWVFQGAKPGRKQERTLLCTWPYVKSSENVLITSIL